MSVVHYLYYTRGKNLVFDPISYGEERRGTCGLLRQRTHQLSRHQSQQTRLHCTVQQLNCVMELKYAKTGYHKLNRSRITSFSWSHQRSAVATRTSCRDVICAEDSDGLRWQQEYNSTRRKVWYMLRPWTKHINMRHHWIRGSVKGFRVEKYEWSTSQPQTIWRTCWRRTSEERRHSS